MELHGSRYALFVQQVIKVRADDEGELRCRTVSYRYFIQDGETPLIRWEYDRDKPREDYDYPLAHVHVHSEANVSRRLKTAIRRANKRLAELGLPELSERVTPHSLRRTYASLRFALRDDPVYVAEQMGHADAGRLAANLYAKATKRRAKLSGVYLAEFDRALEWAQIGNAEPSTSLKVSQGNRHFEGAAAILDPRSGNWQDANPA